MNNQSYEEALEILGLIGLQLRDDPQSISEDNRTQLGEALIAISEEEDPTEVLGIARSRGQRRLDTKKSRQQPDPGLYRNRTVTE